MAARLVHLPVVIITSAVIVGAAAFLAVQLFDDAGESALNREPQEVVEAPNLPEALAADEGSHSSVADQRRPLAVADGAETDLGGPIVEPLRSDQEIPPETSTAVDVQTTISEVTSTTDGPATAEATQDTPNPVVETVPSTSSPTRVSGVATTSTSTARATTTGSTIGATTTIPTEPVAVAAPSTFRTTTTTPVLPAALVASPVEGSGRPWDAAVRFVVNDVPRAANYCWTFLPDNHRECRQGNSYVLPAKSGQVRPGPTTIIVEARDGAGEVLMMDEVRIDLNAPALTVEPASGGWIDVGSRTRLEASPVRTANRYCWDFIQDGLTVGRVCSMTSGVDLVPGGAILGRLALKPVTIRLTVQRASVILGEDSISLFVARRF